MDFTNNKYGEVTIWNIVILPMVSVLVYLIGIHLHSKVIKVSLKEKDLTWKQDIAYSCVVIFHYTHSLLMYGITYIVQDLHTHTGNWFCYGFKALTYYGYLYIQSHTLIISMLKYCIIVRWKMARQIGHEKVKSFCFWANFAYPALMIVIHLIISYDFFWAWDGYSQIERCLGDPKGNLRFGNKDSSTKLSDICKQLHQPSNQNYFEYAIYICRSGICWIQLVISYITHVNIVEMILYCLIFRLMHR
jgi:hypothetical protein